MAFWKSCVWAALLLGAGACTQMVENKENMLAGAGFKMQPANTPARTAELRKMPPHKFTVQTRNGNSIWIYPDPTVCNCLYLGDQQAYDIYRRMMFEKSVAQQEQTAALVNQNSAMPYPFAWETWGPGTPYY